MPRPVGESFNPDTTQTMEQHIRVLWPVLTRPPDTADPRSSLIPLPEAYVVPGGRFREVYYWDSYFTMLGLVAGGRTDLVRGMLDNFAYLVRPVGHIPTGNRRNVSRRRRGTHPHGNPFVLCRPSPPAVFRRDGRAVRRRDRYVTGSALSRRA